MIVLKVRWSKKENYSNLQQPTNQVDLNLKYVTIALFHVYNVHIPQKFK